MSSWMTVLFLTRRWRFFWQGKIAVGNYTVGICSSAGSVVKTFWEQFSAAWCSTCISLCRKWNPTASSCTRTGSMSLPPAAVPVHVLQLQLHMYVLNAKLGKMISPQGLPYGMSCLCPYSYLATQAHHEHVEWAPVRFQCSSTKIFLRVKGHFIDVQVGVHLYSHCHCKLFQTCVACINGKNKRKDAQLALPMICIDQLCFHWRRDHLNLASIRPELNTNQHIFKSQQHAGPVALHGKRYPLVKIQTRAHSLWMLQVRDVHDKDFAKVTPISRSSYQKQRGRKHKGPYQRLAKEHENQNFSSVYHYAPLIKLRTDLLLRRHSLITLHPTYWQRLMPELLIVARASLQTDSCGRYNSAAQVNERVTMYPCAKTGRAWFYFEQITFGLSEFVIKPATREIHSGGPRSPELGDAGGVVRYPAGFNSFRFPHKRPQTFASVVLLWRVIS